MLQAAFYFLQVIFCSAVMMGYYWMALRNKRFHQYNRFYLMGVLIFSWIIPLIKIQWNKPVASDIQVIHFLSLVADRNTEIETTIVNKGFQFNWEWVAIALYGTVAACLSLLLIVGLFKIYRLLKTHSCKSVGEVYLILTQAKGTPFSFFRYIFWHESIDLRSDAGKQMLEHEITHVKEKHSLDKLLIQLVLIAGWFNPFFWLLKKEMELIHEFIADQKAVRNGDTASLAQMLLTAAYPQQQYLLTNPFFFSPIKRRLAMIANHKNPKFSYMRRIVILPLLAIVVVLFAFRSKDPKRPTTISVGTLVEQVMDDFKAGTETASEINTPINIPLEKKYTVVIDAGHGGADHGAMASDGTSESTISLELAKAIASANQHPNINIVLTRSNDETQSIVDKVKIANDQHADLFISLHCNSNASIQSTNGISAASALKGAEIYVASKEKTINYDANIAFANQIAVSIRDLNQPFHGVKTRSAGIYVLQAVQSPSVLIEAGFITNDADLRQMKDASFQKKFAKGVLTGVQQYLLQKEQQFPMAAKDTVVRDTVKSYLTVVGQPLNNQTSPMIILDGVKQEKDFLKKINPNTIESMSVLKGENASKLYGEEGRNGVIIITSKKTSKPDTIKFSVPVNASGLSETVTGISVLGVKLGSIKPLYMMDGKMIDSAELSKKIKADQIKSINILKGESATKLYGPAAVNGVVEIVSKPQKEENGTIENIRLEKGASDNHTAPSFPGGQTGWLKYLERNLNRGLVFSKGGPAGKYSVTVLFQIDPDGNVSDVKADNDPGYGTKEEAIRVIKSGPQWIPAKVNNTPEFAIHKQTITWVVPEK